MNQYYFVVFCPEMPFHLLLVTHGYFSLGSFKLAEDERLKVYMMDI